MRKKTPQLWIPALLGFLLCAFLPVNAFASAEIAPVLESAEIRYEMDAGTDYLSVMQELCMSGDTETGESMELLRNRKIELLNMEEPKIAFQDLYLLSKLIASEAGSAWLSVEWKMAVGEVLLNRVASLEFPDTIEGCIFAPGQYYNVITGAFYGILPDYDSVIAATRLLYGERVLKDSSVVFQANFTQGEVYTVLYDDLLGATYFCKSYHPELYHTN